MAEYELPEGKLVRDNGVYFWHPENFRRAPNGYKEFHYTAQYMHSNPIPEVVYCRNESDLDKLIDYWNRGTRWTYRKVTK